MYNIQTDIILQPFQHFQKFLFFENHLNSNTIVSVMQVAFEYSGAAFLTKTKLPNYTQHPFTQADLSKNYSSISGKNPLVMSRLTICKSQHFKRDRVFNITAFLIWYIRVPFSYSFVVKNNRNVSRRPAMHYSQYHRQSLWMLRPFFWRKQVF